MKTRILIFCTAFLTVLSSSAGIVVEQTQITGKNDYGTGSGQSFLLAPGESVAAVELHIGSVGNGGGSVLVRLWEVSESSNSYLAKVGTDPLATGTLNRTSVSGTPNWFTVPLDRTYTNSSPEAIRLVFELELLTSGASGWNDYSFSNQNPYADGGAVYWDRYKERFIDLNRENVDMAFRILGSVPEPQPAWPLVEVEKIPESASEAASLEFFIRESVVGYDYTCFTTEDLATPLEEWHEDFTETGNGRRLSWSFKIATSPRTLFIQIRASPNADFEN
jgi:hypothetical protein